VARKTHREEWWESGAKPGVRRCLAQLRTGTQCRTEAIQGSTVCGKHGGLAPQVQKRAKERVAIVADAITQQMYAWFHDETIPIHLRLKIGQDFLDRGGIDKSMTLQIGVDPVEQLLRDLLGSDDGLEPERIEPEATFELEDRDGDYIDADVIDTEYNAGEPMPEPDQSLVEMERLAADANNTPLPRPFADDFKAGRFAP
jgi:hypothetical protein